MANIVPIGLGIDDRDLFTLWAPRWRDANDEWEAFLGKDEDLYAFESVADLVAFVRANSDNDLVDHPGWSQLTARKAGELDPEEDKRFDLIRVYEILAEDPTKDSVTELAATLAIVSSIGSVCDLTPITKLFNGNPVLALVSGGIVNFADKIGRRRWDDLGAVVDKNWEKVLDAVNDVLSTPDVDDKASAEAAEELKAAKEAEEERKKAAAESDEDDTETTAEDEADDTDEAAESDASDVTDDEDDEDDEESESAAAAEAAHDDVVLGGDEDFWIKVGIDPVRVITSGDTYYTLRCYLDDTPIFLGRNGRISVFSSERLLARYLADEHDHDLSDLATYDDIRTAATDGSLRVDVTEDNIYVLRGLGDDIADGLDAIDRDQLELAVEFLRDIGDYSEDSTVEKTLREDTPLGKVIAYVLDPESVDKPKSPSAKAVDQWTALETFVESRLRSE